MASRLTITYAHRDKRSRSAQQKRDRKVQLGPFTSLSSTQSEDAIGLKNLLQEAEVMEERNLKRTRGTSSQPIPDAGLTNMSRATSSPGCNVDADSKCSDSAPSTYFDALLALQTPLPTSLSASETYHPPSGVGKPMLPDEFSPLPKIDPPKGSVVTTKAKASYQKKSKENTRLTEATASHRKSSTKLVRTKSETLKENGARQRDMETLKKSKKLTALSLAGLSSKAEKNLKLPVLSSPFNSQPGSPQLLPTRLEAKFTQESAYMHASERVPLVSRLPSRSNNFATNDRGLYIQSTSTSPANSDIGSRIALDKERRPSAPTGTRPNIAAFHEPRRPSTGFVSTSEDIRPVSELGHHGMINSAFPSPDWATLGVSFDRPPSQLDYTHTFAYDGFPEFADFGYPLPAEHDSSAFWSDVLGVSTPFAKDNGHNLGSGKFDGDKDSVGPFDDEEGDYAEAADEDCDKTMLPFLIASRPGSRGSLPFDCSPSERRKNGASTDLPTDMKMTLPDRSPWLSDSLISPPSIYQRKAGIASPGLDPHLFSPDNEHELISHTTFGPSLNSVGQDDVVPHATKKDSSEVGYHAKTGARSITDNAQETNLNVTPSGDLPSSGGASRGGLAPGVCDIQEATMSTNSNTIVVNSMPRQGRSRRGTIKASDHPASSSSSALVTDNGNITRRTRSGTITLRNSTVVPLGVTSGGSCQTSGTRRTRSGTVVGPALPAPGTKTATNSVPPLDVSSTQHMDHEVISSDDPINLLGPPIDLGDETWVVAPRTSPHIPRARRKHPGGPSRSSARPGNKLHSMRELMVMHEGVEDLRLDVSDDELLLREGDRFD